MTKKYAVSYISFHENDLTIAFVEADNWKDALFLHPEIKKNCNEDYFEEWKGHLPDDIEEAKSQFFEGDSLFDVKEITI